MKTKAFAKAAGFAAFSLLLALCCGAVSFMFRACNTASGEASAADKTDFPVSLPVIVIDAGHGGEDGGAVGVNGLVEKECNLAVSEILAALFRAGGAEVIMTRSEDRLLYTEHVKGTLKIQDLKNRLDIAQAQENSVFISIHMNKFIESKYSGLQVYFSPNHSKSRELALSIQESVCSLLQPENNRKIKRATSSIYLLDRLQCPAVMVECGFLSNPQEAELLADDDYRHRVAMVLYASVMREIAPAA